MSIFGHWIIGVSTFSAADYFYDIMYYLLLSTPCTSQPTLITFAPMVYLQCTISNNDPELDTSPELDPDTASYYLTVISILKSMIKLVRMDIITKVSLVLSHVVLPRVGHLETAIHVMAHDGEKYNSRLVYEPSYPEIDHNVFKKWD